MWIFQALEEYPYSSGIIIKFTSVSLSLKRWTYAAKDSLSDYWISIKWLIDVWMSEFEIFKWRESLISSLGFCEVKASDISVLTNPLDFACANLVLLLPVNSEAVLMSVSQSSSCEESCPFNVGISCNKELSKQVFFCAVHKVSVYLSNTYFLNRFWWGAQCEC